MRNKEWKLLANIDRLTGVLGMQTNLLNEISDYTMEWVDYKIKILYPFEVAVAMCS